MTASSLEQTLHWTAVNLIYLHQTSQIFQELWSVTQQSQGDILLRLSDYAAFMKKEIFGKCSSLRLTSILKLH